MNAVADALDEAWSHRVDEHPTALAYAADGRLLAIGDAGGHVALVDTVDGRVVATHLADRRGVLALAWHPRERRLAVGGQSGVVRCFGPAGPESETALDGAWVEHLAWHPDGRLLAATQGRSIVVLDGRGERVATSAPLPSTVTGLAFRAGGRQLVSGFYGGVAVHDVASLAVTRRFRHAGSVVALALSANDRIVACGCQDNTVHFWRFADGRDAQMSGYPAKPKSLSFSSDSQWLATGGSPDVIVWPFDGRGPEGRPPRVLRAHESVVALVAFAPSGPGLVSADRDGLLCLWVPGAREAPLATRRLGAAVAGLAWGADGEHARLAVADAGGTVRGWTL